MNLPRPAPSYDSGNEAMARNMIELEDRRNRKIGADVEIGRERLVLKSPNGTRWNIMVSDSGVIAATAL